MTESQDAPESQPKPAQSQAAVSPQPQTKPAPIISSPGRRQFLSWFGVAWVAFLAATGGALSLVLRYLFPNVLFEPKTSFKVGFPDDYEIGVVDTRWKAKYGVWIVRVTEGMYALIAVCTHLGCTPNWLEDAQKFKCPCHGSGFYKSGINFEGPAPRPLERAKITLADDGQVLVDKSKKFQQEKGEWNNPDAFLAI